MEFPRVVYGIQHNETGRIYIGSSQELEVRIRSHLYMLRSGTHHNALMQKDYDEYGEDYTVFEIEVINNADERDREFYWMEKLHTDDPTIGYNGKDPHFTRGKKIVIEFTQGIPVPNFAEFSAEGHKISE